MTKLPPAHPSESCVQLAPARGVPNTSPWGCVQERKLSSLPEESASGMLEKLEGRWRTTGLWGSVLSYKQEVLTEPKGGSDLLDKVL
eukprot:180240-Pyramimonas_sp.AAC.1